MSISGFPEQIDVVLGSSWGGPRAIELGLAEDDVITLTKFDWSGTDAWSEDGTQTPNPENRIMLIPSCEYESSTYYTYLDVLSVLGWRSDAHTTMYFLCMAFHYPVTDYTYNFKDLYNVNPYFSAGYKTFLTANYGPFNPGLFKSMARHFPFTWTMIPLGTELQKSLRRDVTADVAAHYRKRRNMELEADIQASKRANMELITSIATTLRSVMKLDAAAHVGVYSGDTELDTQTHKVLRRDIELITSIANDIYNDKMTLDTRLSKPLRRMFTLDTSIRFPMWNQMILDIELVVQSIVYGYVRDFRGNIVKKKCTLVAASKDGSIVYGMTNSNPTTGYYSIGMNVGSGNEVMLICFYEGTFRGQTNMAGSLIATTE